MGQSTSWSPHSVLASAEPSLASSGQFPQSHRDQIRIIEKFLAEERYALLESCLFKRNSSDKEETKKQVEEFNRDFESHLETIYRQLLRGKFKFLPAQGILIPRKGKRPRPIVKSPIPARIVQRRFWKSCNPTPQLSRITRTLQVLVALRESGLVCLVLLGLSTGRLNLIEQNFT